MSEMFGGPIHLSEEQIQSLETHLKHAEIYGRNALVLNTSVFKNNDGFEVHWIVPGIGFGSFNFALDTDGKVKIWNEAMGPQFIKHVMRHVLENAQLME